MSGCDWQHRFLLNSLVWKYLILNYKKIVFYIYQSLKECNPLNYIFITSMSHSHMFRFKVQRFKLVNPIFVAGLNSQVIYWRGTVFICIFYTISMFYKSNSGSWIFRSGCFQSQWWKTPHNLFIKLNTEKNVIARFSWIQYHWEKCITLFFYR